MEFLPDPIGDRPLKDLPPFVNKALDDTFLFPRNSEGVEIPDWKILEEFMQKEGPLMKPQVMKIIAMGTEIFKNEPNLVKIPEPVVVVGDIHGQYYDLVHMLNKAGDPAKLNYLFMGDYVDRGIFGLQCMMLLISIKINFPKKFILLRGNHESRNMTESFTFREEVIQSFDNQVYDAFMELFDALPIACVVDDKYLAMHGGISPELNLIEEINSVNRFQEIPLDGLFCDLMWADPMKDENAKHGEFADNPERECSNYFGKKPVKKLLKQNKLMSIFRGHQVQVDGFKMHRWGNKDSFPYVITIFSAPNYCGYYDNKGSILILDEGNLQLKQYQETEPPYRLPDGLNVFSWSLPFLAEKVSSMLYTIVKKCSNYDEKDDEKDAINIQEIINDDISKLPSDQAKVKKRLLIKGKIQSVAKMNKMFTVLKEESELILKIKNIAPDGKLPRGLLLEGKPAIKNMAKQFNFAAELDRDNEKRPKKKNEK